MSIQNWTLLPLTWAAWVQTQSVFPHLKGRLHQILAGSATVCRIASQFALALLFEWYPDLKQNIFNSSYEMSIHSWPFSLTSITGMCSCTAMKSDSLITALSSMSNLQNVNSKLGFVATKLIHMSANTFCVPLKGLPNPCWICSYVRSCVAIRSGVIVQMIGWFETESLIFDSGCSCWFNQFNDFSCTKSSWRYKLRMSLVLSCFSLNQCTRVHA